MNQRRDQRGCAPLDDLPIAIVYPRVVGQGESGVGNGHRYSVGDGDGLPHRHRSRPEDGPIAHFGATGRSPQRVGDDDCLRGHGIHQADEAALDGTGVAQADGVRQAITRSGNSAIYDFGRGPQIRDVHAGDSLGTEHDARPVGDPGCVGHGQTIRNLRRQVNLVSDGDWPARLDGPLPRDEPAATVVAGPSGQAPRHERQAVRNDVGEIHLSRRLQISVAQDNRVCQAVALGGDVLVGSHGRSAQGMEKGDDALHHLGCVVPGERLEGEGKEHGGETRSGRRVSQGAHLPLLTNESR